MKTYDTKLFYNFKKNLNLKRSIISSKVLYYNAGAYKHGWSLGWVQVVKSPPFTFLQRRKHKFLLPL